MSLDVAFLVALLQIIGLDLVLAGDNAVVIALAARNLPTHLQRRAVVFGALAAIALRAALTAGVWTLLAIPFLKLAGGIVLMRIAWKLALDGDRGHGNVAPAGDLRTAISTILMADVVMSLDNVLAVAAAAEGHERGYVLIILGLLISIPIVMGGATILLGVVRRFPGFVWVGAGLIAYTAVELVLSDPLVHTRIVTEPAWLLRGVSVLVTVTFLAGALYRKRANKRKYALMVESNSTDE